MLFFRAVVSTINEPSDCHHFVANFSILVLLNTGHLLLGAEWSPCALVEAPNPHDMVSTFTPNICKVCGNLHMQWMRIGIRHHVFTITHVSFWEVTSWNPMSLLGAKWSPCALVEAPDPQPGKRWGVNDWRPDCKGLLSHPKEMWQWKSVKGSHLAIPSQVRLQTHIEWFPHPLPTYQMCLTIFSLHMQWMRICVHHHAIATTFAGPDFSWNLVHCVVLGAKWRLCAMVEALNPNPTWKNGSHVYSKHIKGVWKPSYAVAQWSATDPGLLQQTLDCFNELGVRRACTTPMQWGYWPGSTRAIPQRGINQGPAPWELMAPLLSLTHSPWADWATLIMRI